MARGQAAALSVYRAARRSLASGEVDPDLRYSSDLVAARNGAEVVRNFIIRTKGTAERRPGTEFVAKAKVADGPARLYPFIPGGGKGYVCEYSDGVVRVRDGDDPSIVSDDVATPYGAADLAALKFAQSIDVQWIFSAAAFSELRRTAVSPLTFELVDAVFRGGPFMDRNTDQAHTIGASAATGSGITLTSSAALFTAAHVGAIFLLDEIDYSYTPKWEKDVTPTLGDLVRYDGNVYECVDVGTKKTYEPPTHIEGEQHDRADGIAWLYLHSGYGLVQITAVTDGTTATADVLSRLPSQIVTTPTDKWWEGAWSNARGWPRCGALHKDALWCGSTAAEPARVWKSAIAGYDDFTAGTEDDAALSRDLLAAGTNALRWMVPGNVLAIGTDGPEWVAKPESQADTIRTTNLITDVATNEGSSDVAGVAIGSETLFLDAEARRLRASEYDFGSDAFKAADLTIFAEHILGRGVVQMCYQRTPWRCLWFVLEGGELAGMTYHPEQNMFAWHRHDFGDPVVSATVVPVDGGARDALYLLIDRGGELAIERMVTRWEPARGDDLSDAWYLDSAIRSDVPEPSAEVSGLDHLEGREVIALVDGKHHPPVTVTDGAVTLNFAGTVRIVGLANTARVRFLPFDLGQADDSQIGRNKSVSALVVPVRDALGGGVSVVGGRAEPAPFQRFGATPLDARPEPFTGPLRIPAPGGTAPEVQIEITNDTAWPTTILGLIPEYEV